MSLPDDEAAMTAEDWRAECIRAGFGDHPAYSVREWALALDVTTRTLYDEHDAGRLKFVRPLTRTRGAMITCKEVARWWAEAEDR